MATVPISVRDLQEGLTSFASSAEGQHARAAGPGAIDGVWGPNTYTSLSHFVAYQAPIIQADAARLLAPLRNRTRYPMPPQGRVQSIMLDDRLVRSLNAYRETFEPHQERARVTRTEPSSTPLLPQRPPMMWPWVLGGGLLLFGLGWWLWRRVRG